ncbi:MAG: NAD-dependent epimerase/dehydratase family protein [Actinomycetota bacterium]|nr:NAD-dependent epimerase/dehydratase family protein [Actinomycetota bacterium]
MTGSTGSTSRGNRPLVVVTGAGGFIGGHLVASLVDQGGCQIRAIDARPTDSWLQCFEGVDNRQLDLTENPACAEAVAGATRIFNLASDMGGIGFIENNKAACMLSVLINTHLLQAAQRQGVERYFFASSACVYPQGKQDVADVVPLRESDAYPAMPEDGYGWEKLFSERMCRHFSEDFGLPTRVARFHNIYGPHGTFDGGREKAPAAICRKVAHAKLSGNHEIELWGDGEQTRSFTYIDDCLHGMQLIVDGDVSRPLNVGSSELVTINGLVDIVERIAGIKVRRHHRLDAPLGVRGRNSDNTLIRQLLHWAPSITLECGMEHTFRWVYDRIAADGGARVA